MQWAIAICWICATIVPFCAAERWISWHLFNETQPPIPPQSYYSSALGNHIRAQWNVSNRSINTQSYQELYFDEAIEAIYRHQHPQDCSKASFMVSVGYPSGFGSEVHVEGVGLAIAMELGRIYLPARQRPQRYHWQTPFKICNGTKHQFKCYFEPWTNCTYEDVDRLARLQPKVRMFKTDDQAIEHFLSTGRISDQAKQVYGSERVINMFLDIHFKHLRFLVPKQLSNIVSSKMKLTRVRRYYWWRAVAAAYLLRPNDNTMRWVSQYSIPAVQSLQGKCVSMYIRHGDKAREMKLIPFEKYMDTAKSLWIQQYGQNSTAVKTVMLGTETPRILNQAMKYQESHPEWNIVFNQLQVEIFSKKGLGGWGAHKEKESNPVGNNRNHSNSEIRLGKGKRNSNQAMQSKVASPINAVQQLSGAPNRTQHHPVKNKPYKHIIKGKTPKQGSRRLSAMEEKHSSQISSRRLKELEVNQQFFERFTDLDYISFIVNLVDLMRCDIFVCTLASNYCRVLDELRAMVAAKPDSLFADLSYETCTNPPCVGPHGFKSFDW